ncbi:MAG: radical SAM protein [Lachnospiraceae bacterium]|nr:radical SAM protein [Lachnospiraceae bacterium]
MNKKSTEPYLSTYLHSKGRKLGLPIAGNFELTARCNFNCPMCYVHMTEEQVRAAGKELTAEQWISIAREARDRGMIFVLLTGGEPLMRRDFFEIYRGMKKLGLLISINSNGFLLQGEILERFLQDPPARFNISLYGGSDETYEQMCGRPAYQQVKENIRRLRAAGVEVTVNLSITPYNRQDLAQIYADAVELDVNVKSSSYMYPQVRVNGEQFGCGNRLTAEEAAQCSVEWDLLRFSEEEFALRARNMERVIAKSCAGRDADGWADDSGEKTAECAENKDGQMDEIRDGCPVESDEGVRCRAGSTSFWMTWDGRMLPCGMMTTPVVYPLKVGFGAAWEELRDRTAEIRTPLKCAGCAYRDVCGVCAAVCFTETGRFDGVPHYVCEKTVAQVRITGEECRKRKVTDHEDKETADQA